MPGTRCSVAICNNSYKDNKRNNLNISFHNFPKDKTLRKCWIKACCRKDVWDPKNRTVCSVHFKNDDFETGLRNKLMDNKVKQKLKPTAIPSQLLSKIEVKKYLNSKNNLRSIRAEKRSNKKLVQNLLVADSLQLPLQELGSYAGEKLEVKHNKYIQQNKNNEVRKMSDESCGIFIKEDENLCIEETLENEHVNLINQRKSNDIEKILEETCKEPHKNTYIEETLEEKHKEFCTEGTLEKKHEKCIKKFKNDHVEKITEKTHEELMKTFQNAYIEEISEETYEELTKKHKNACIKAISKEKYEEILKRQHIHTEKTLEEKYEELIQQHKNLKMKYNKIKEVNQKQKKLIDTLLFCSVSMNFN